MTDSTNKRPVSGVGIAVHLLEITPAVKRRVMHEIKPGAMALWEAFGRGPVILRDLEESFGNALPEIYLLLQQLWTNKAVALTWPADEPELEVSAATTGEVLNLALDKLDGHWKLSRFASIHADDAGNIVVETPCVPTYTRILKPRIAALLSALARPRSAQQLTGELGWSQSSNQIADLVFLLRIAGIINRVNADGVAEEDLCPALLQWEPHDLLFHARSRQGRHDHPMGGNFRFKGRLSPQPPVRSNTWRANAIPLWRPDLYTLAATDPSFTAVLESRQSIRSHNYAKPITLTQLGEFLFRSARIRHQFQTEIGEFTSRPYPSGGASYELEIYITINLCMGLERGFYYYDPQAHSLCFIRPPDAEMEALLDDAWLSAARLCRPQILLTIASRFQRVSWKYSGIAYAAQLKNVGVLYQTFYLVATAMQLAGCGLGLGNASRFCRLSGANYFEESSVGEFMLGTPA